VNKKHKTEVIGKTDFSLSKVKIPTISVLTMKASILLVLLISIIACQLVDAKKEKRKPKNDKEKKLFKEQIEKRQKDAKKKFKDMKNSDQVDRIMGNSMMRADKKGGKLAIQRKGQYFVMKIKEIVARHSNETEITKTKLKDVKFTITGDKNDTSTYGVQAAYVQMVGRLPNGGNVTLQLFMFKDAGNVTGEDGNIYELVEGGTKANLRVEWPNEADHLDLVIAVQCGFDVKKAKKAMKAMKTRGRKGMKKAMNRRNPETFSVCSNARMTFSPAYNTSMSDNSTSMDYDMPTGYPKSKELSGEGESEIVLRFNGTRIFYDPTVETGEDIGEEAEFEASNNAISLHTPNLVIAVVFSMIFLKLLL